MSLLLACASFLLSSGYTTMADDSADIQLKTCGEAKVDSSCRLSCTTRNVNMGVTIKKDNDTQGQCLPSSSSCASSDHRYNVTLDSGPTHSTMFLYITTVRTKDAGRWVCQTGDLKSEEVDVNVYGYGKIKQPLENPRVISIFCFYPKPTFKVENSTCELDFRLREQKLSNCTDKNSKSYLVDVEPSKSCKPGVLSIAAYAGELQVQTFNYTVQKVAGDRRGSGEEDDGHGTSKAVLVVTTVLLLLLFAAIIVYLFCCYFRGKRFVRCKGRDRQTPEEVHEEVEKKIMMQEIDRIEHEHFSDHHDDVDDNNKHLKDNHGNVDDNS